MKQTLVILLILIAAYAVTHAGGDDPTISLIQSQVTHGCTRLCCEIEDLKRTIGDNRCRRSWQKTKADCLAREELRKQQTMQQ